MGLQRYRADFHQGSQSNGCVPWYTRWMGGPTLSLIRRCPTPFGPRTVYIRGEPDTWFSIPAACEFRRRTIHGYVTTDNSGNWEFRAMRDATSIFPVVLEG